ncbi:MAG: 3-methyl-2-oxobutanoate hydroxymethyltransferase [Helicobacteraceae bacterium]|nr:3-methyl-2-oxobutanoate hydroxymethyltransferase [Helicobacteraceae bacterium]
MSLQNTIKQITISQILRKKNNEKITMITAYDALFAGIFDGFVDMILVGDSLNMSFFGAKDTLSASLEQMIYHTKAVCNGAKTSLVICDMPFGSTKSEAFAIKSAIRILKETEAQAVKIEGGAELAPLIKKLSQNGVAVMAHIGLKPQFVRLEGGYKIKGKEKVESQNLIQEAKALEEAGAFSILLEGTKAEAASELTKAVGIPVIGIGSGNEVDGQVLVWSDAFGFFSEFKPKFVREFLNGRELVQNALKNYVESVKNGDFPSKSESY